MIKHGFYRFGRRRKKMSISFFSLQDVNDEELKIAVIVCTYNGKLVMCKHKERNSWEFPGGHREAGETIIEAAERELYEETGAVKFDIKPVCAYKITKYAMLLYGEITEFGEKPQSEIECVEFFEALPKELVYPTIHPYLYEKAMEFISREPEVWDAYYPDGTLAGADLIRGQRIPKEYRHGVAEVFVIHKDGSILLMQRDFNKPNYPGFWESGAGGSLIKGETFLEAAKRELQEETGITAENLSENYEAVTYDTIYKGYVCITNAPKDSVKLQEGETINYKWVNKEEFLKVFQSEEFVSSLKDRLKEFVNNLDKYGCGTE